MAYETNAFGLDLSHYDFKVDASQLAGVVDFLTIKAGGTDWPYKAYLDERFAERVQMAKDIGALCGAYWFVNPRYWLEWAGGTGMSMKTIDGMNDDEHPLLKIIRDQLKYKEIYWLAFDVEKNSLPTNHGTVTDVWIKYYISDLVERITRQQGKGNMRPFKMGVYSSRSFIDGTQYSPPKPQTSLETYLGVQPNMFIWTANWIEAPDELTTPADVKANHHATHIAKSFGYCEARPKTWQFWQWSGDNGRVFSTNAIQNDKGQARGMDCNYFNGTVEQLRAWAGVTVTPPPVEPPVEPPPTGEVVDLQARADIEEIKKFMANVKAA